MFFEMDVFFIAPPTPLLAFLHHAALKSPQRGGVRKQPVRGLLFLCLFIFLFIIRWT
jgi:hypothetical protein